MASANLKIWKGNTLLFSGAETGTLTAGDRVRFSDILYGPLALCYASQPPRGAFGSGNFNGIGINRTGWVVNQSVVTNLKAGIGKLSIEWEAGGAYATMALPVGDFSLTPQELYPKIERAGCFVGITFATLNVCYNCLYLATNSSGSPLVSSTFLTDKISDPTQLALAQNLVSKLLKGEETFYLAGWRYTYTYFSYTVPALSAGGIIRKPGGPLGGSLPAGVAWLRLADTMEPAGVNGSMYKITVAFIGGPTMGGVNYWDADVYPV
jgi:hypothetical protein